MKNKMEYNKSLHCSTQHPKWFITHILRWRKENIPICLLFVFYILLIMSPVCAQENKFPDLFNTALNRPVQTVPTTGTCGITRKAFCKSSIYAISFTGDCIQDYCDQTCPRRQTLPTSLDLLLLASGYGPCVTMDTINTRPGSGPGVWSSTFFVGQNCYITPQTLPSLGSNGAFSLTFWVWLDTDTLGTVIEKWSNSGETILRLQISPSVVKFTYRINSSPRIRHVTFSETLPVKTWLFLAFQVYDQSLSYFVDGTGLHFSAAGTSNLIGQILDENGDIRVGQSNSGSEQFRGRLQDLKFFGVTLTNREIDEIYKGVLPSVRIQSPCRCPPTHPRIQPSRTEYCIPNGEPDNTSDMVKRLNNYAHPLGFLNDGDGNSFWVSKIGLDDITIEIDLGDQFQIFHVVLQFYSPFPEVVTIERQKSYGDLWERWQLYADDCEQRFGMPNNGPLATPSSVNCLQFNTNTLVVPYSKGNITFAVLPRDPVPRPGHNNFYNTPELFEFVKAAQIRVRLQGHFYVIWDRHKYYGIYEHNVIGRCNCHGHGTTCELTDRPYVCNCNTNSFTEGNQCERCMALYNDKPFRDGGQFDPYNCRPCQCYDHAASCVYDKTKDEFPDDHSQGGGGVCVDCQHNTQGINCEQCKEMYFRPIGKSLFDPDVCSPCDCNEDGIQDDNMMCDKEGGQCSCRLNVEGRQCDKCKLGYFNLQSANPVGCEACNCATIGTVNQDIRCEQTTGLCRCKKNVRGTQCDACQFAYYGLSETNPDGCSPCECNPIGTLDQFCNPVSGQCNCAQNKIGRKCDQCVDGYWNFDGGCEPCACNAEGSVEGTVCNKDTGACVCREYVEGLKCDVCKVGYYLLGKGDKKGCLKCGCNFAGTIESTTCIKDTGECICKANVETNICNRCKPWAYNLTASNPDGCENCGCDPTGTEKGDQLQANFLTCDTDTGDCSCLDHREGSKCDRCASGYYPSTENGKGCLACDCHKEGSSSIVPCNTTGHCYCKKEYVGMKCDTCAEGYYIGRDQNYVEVCLPCDCNPAGSTGIVCQTIYFEPGNPFATLGQCNCKKYVTGDKCTKCVNDTSNLQADNPLGCSSAPSQQPPPTANVLSSSSIQVLWGPPDYPGGPILEYKVYRNNVVIATIDTSVSATPREYTDTGLEAYTVYEYKIEAVNEFGSTISTPALHRTLQASPEGDITVEISDIEARSVTLSWTQPTNANGVILKYEVMSTTLRNPSPPVKLWEGLATSTILTGLTPYTYYTFQVNACTQIGCLLSPGVVGDTMAAAPENQQPPTIVAKSPTELHISWDPPLEPNGIIIYYDLWMQGVPDASGVSNPPATLIFRPAGQYNPRPALAPQETFLDPPATEYSVMGLDPYTAYEFKVGSQNGVQRVESVWARGRTDEAGPIFMPTPEIEVVSSTQLNITWRTPTDKEARGAIIFFKIHKLQKTDPQASPFAPPYIWVVAGQVSADATFFVAGGFEPFSEQTFHVELCNSVDCVNSADVRATTAVGAPAEQSPVNLIPFNDTSMKIEWKPPSMLNGPTPTYKVFRYDMAFNSPPAVTEQGTRHTGSSFYEFPPDTIPQGTTFTGFDLWFRTREENGLLLFAALVGQNEFIALQLQFTRPWFIFDPQDCLTRIQPDPSLDGNRSYSDGEWHHLRVHRLSYRAVMYIDGELAGCATIVTTTDDEGLPYNDNLWHHFVAWRDQTKGFIQLDEWTGQKELSCPTGSVIGPNDGVYIGGLPDDYIDSRQELDSRSEITDHNFIGCIRDFKILMAVSPEEVWKDLDYNTAVMKSDGIPPWGGCPIINELDTTAMHYLGTGYAVWDISKEVNTIVLDIIFRTDKRSGLLFLFTGEEQTYMFAQIADGGLYFEMGFQGIVRKSLVFPNDLVPICDGTWKTLKFEKSGEYLKATVDGDNVVENGGDLAKHVLLLFRGDMYIGGVDPYSEAYSKSQAMGFTDRLSTNFAGCLKAMNLKMGNFDYLTLHTANVLRSVDMRGDGCPKEREAQTACDLNKKQLIYDTNDLTAYDHDLEPYTEYMYQVQASNPGGMVTSAWASARTKPGPPNGVPKPTDVRIQSGYIIQAQWGQATGTNTGPITEYRLRAYNQDNPDLPPVEAIYPTFPSIIQAGQISDALPHTNYEVVVAACTEGGCANSDGGGVMVQTLTEPPAGVVAPYTLENGGDYVLVGWDPSAMPNGIVTGYSLYKDDAQVYTGGLLQFNVTDLSVFTGYSFFVLSCTNAGCTPSDKVTLSTSQLAPTSVDPPTLTVLGTTRMRVNWVNPVHLNGQLQAYLVYVSTVELDQGKLVYNSSDFFTYYTLEDLMPGTIYYVRVGACTEGGCTTSEYSSARTAESAPEGIFPPNVTSPSPSELDVTWQVPEFPNGVIVEYRLYHNEIRVFAHPSMREYHLTGLQPWSLHLFRLEACTSTANGCGSSDDVQVRTQEAPPEGIVGLTLKVIGSREVDIQWNGPAIPNGLIYYNAYFNGSYYKDPENWDYSIVHESRSLYQTTTVSQQWVRVERLVPYSTYYVKVIASNTQGAIDSNLVRADMPMGSPDGVQPMELVSETSTSVRAVWRPVGRANADEQPVFQLQFRETYVGAIVQNLFDFPTTSMTFVKAGLEPFTKYEFKLLASNNYGTTQTEWQMILTKQDKPENQGAPVTSEVTSTSLRVTWDPPIRPNGIIMEYKLHMNNAFRQSVFGNVTTVLMSNLIPFSPYVFRVESCTIGGCTTSPDSISVMTDRAAPDGLEAPLLVSNTPTSVLVSWKEPSLPNGILQSYTVERKMEGSPFASTVTIKPALPDTADYEYLDQSLDISPYTVYQYRIIASTAAGNGYSDWATVTTKSSRPGGVKKPFVVVLNSTSLSITWEPPIIPNGRMESYVIKLPFPRQEIFDVNVTSTVMYNLIPDTEYRVSVTACSDGGCTESTQVLVRTSMYIPSGQLPPVATPHSQNFISIIWDLPLQPNGPITMYELSRQKIRQPLDASATNFYIWTRIYTGPETYYEDRGLTLYTTYEYRVTSFNSRGQASSDPSREVTTFGSVPTKAATVVSSAIDHTSILISWDTPSVEELQGGVVLYQVSAQGGETNVYDEFGPDQERAIFDDLAPSTQYKVIVTMVMHGGEVISSSPIYVKTLDGAPEGLDDPQLLVVDENTLNVLWTAPSEPNGQVTGYFIYLDGDKIDTNMATPGSYLLPGLQPYTIYTIQLEVCTVYDCTKSNEIIGTTAEAIPQEIPVPRLSVQGPNAVRVTWVEPLQPNGIIIRYHLLRRDKLTCDINNDDTDVDEQGVCNYFECGILESFCGNQCYSGTKTCCDGVVHNNRGGYECCGKDYIPQRTSSTDVCCGGRFYLKLNNHQCCGNRYVEVLAGEICCPDSTFDRVVVGAGDTCCESIPYHYDGPQICCNNALHDGYDQHCCGGAVIPVTQVCCGNDTHGVPYQPDPSKFCCGDQYILTETAVCCSQHGQSKVHEYQSAMEKLAANEKCCGLERISAQLSCCNNKGYNPITQSCADYSDMQAGCGLGTVCPIAQSVSAFCDVCDFNRMINKCGSAAPTIAPQEGTALPVGLCWTQPSIVYRGMDFSFTDENLEPYTEYAYSLVAVNTAGSGTSEYAEARTLSTIPEGVLPPTATVDSDRLDTIHLAWQPPTKPNGEIVQYVLFRDGVEIYRQPDSMKYTDNNVIQPYQTYTYKLRACTVEGCADSDPIQVATLQARPEGVNTPVITGYNESALTLAWDSPSRPNGFITEYEMHLLTQHINIILPPTQRYYTASGLEPYTEYSFILTACTMAGCTNSSTVRARTSEALPTGLHPPNVIVRTSTTVEVYWNPPEFPNGVIIMYRVYRLVPGTPFVLVYSGNANQLTTSDSSLAPSSTYAFLVEALNGAGGVNSSAVGVDLPTSTPSDITAPSNVTVLSPYNMFVEWDEPPISGPNIDQYTVVLNAGSSNAITWGAGSAFHLMINGLSPYTLYRVRIGACLRGVVGGCGLGPGVSARTHEAPPAGMMPPSLKPKGPSVIDIEWDIPSDPNGIIYQYRIHRRMFGESGAGLLINVLDGNTYLFTNAGPELKSYTEYEYKITAVNVRGETQSTWTRTRTLQSAPKLQDIPVLSNIQAYSVTVSWNPPMQPNGIILSYRIEYREEPVDPTREYPVHKVTVSESVRTATISGLVPNARHQIRIIAENEAGQASSDWVAILTGQAPPTGVGPFLVEKMSNGLSVILRWSVPTNPNGRINNYVIYEEGSVSPIYQGITREFEYRRLQPYTTYTIQLEACSIGGCGRSPKQTFTTAEVAPADIATPTVVKVTDTSVTLKWKKPVNPNGLINMYQVFRKERTRVVKRDTNPGVAIYETTDTQAEEYEYTDTSLKPFTEYEYVIRASNSEGYTDSPSMTVQTEEAAPQGIPAPVVTYVGTESDRLHITWSEPSQPNGIVQMYRIHRNSSATWIFDPTDDKEYTDKGLSAFTPYSYTVVVCTSGGCGSSEATIVRTPESTPYFVNPPDLMTISSTAIRATWTKPQITNGQIKEYQLLVDGQIRFIGTTMEFVVQNLTPYKAYQFVLRACTFGGCNDSVAVLGRPGEAPPEGMRSPELHVTSSTSIEISWNPPDYPNGVITSYDVRRDGNLITTTTNTIYFDYEVQPGKEYTYTVTAFNSQGSATSLPAAATTYASSPLGLAPPKLVAESSTTVRATWVPPIQPNGFIHNYTLSKNNEIVFSGRQLDTVVDGLDHWTTYSFRVQACTSNGCTLSDPATVRTLESSPQGLLPPRLTAYANRNGAHDGVLVEWSAPSKPNGIIIRYEIYRRDATGLPPDVSGGTIKLLYSGLDMSYVDRDPAVEPYTVYEYNVVAFNTMGSVSSLWEDVITKEAPPDDVPAPRVKSTTATTITLEIIEPVTPNGNIENFNIYVNSVLEIKGRSTLAILGDDDAEPLIPFTSYEIYVEVCTAGGCTASPVIVATTDTQTPAGLLPPTLHNITRTSMDLQWVEPSQQNGQIKEYELFIRKGCPQPYADPTDQLNIPCDSDATPMWVSKVRGNVFSAHIDGLLPYTAYDFRLQAYNDAGGLANPPESQGFTLPAPPEYNQNFPPDLTPTGNVIRVNWVKSFFINGEVIRFILYVNDAEKTRGFLTTYDVFRESVYSKYKISVKLVTEQGEVSTPSLVFDPTGPDVIGPPTVTPQPVVDTSTPVYQEVWFIVLVAVICLVILFIGLACCLRSSGRKMPYIRERMPLQPQQQKAPFYLDPYNGSVISTDIPIHSQPSLHTTPAHHNGGYVNPAFSQLSIASRTASLADLNLDKLSHKSSRWGEEEDDMDWEANYPPDSGLHSLAYGEEYDTASDRPISVLKEHTMFTDTHL